MKPALLAASLLHPIAKIPFPIRHLFRINQVATIHNTTGIIKTDSPIVPPNAFLVEYGVLRILKNSCRTEKNYAKKAVRV